ncbi:MAG: Na+/H+ antiporter NhaA, partial [Angustibacter sp.]
KLQLSASAWAADGLLAIFFFVAGLELKRELVLGELRDPARAALPVVAAVAGVVVPAGIFLLVAGSDAAQGWAVPTATDIAFALAALAVIGSHLPSALRAFLLTLAVVDDLIAITIIAIFYTKGLSLAPLFLAVLPLAAFGLVARWRRARPWLLIPLALTTWGLVHASGVHATVAGVLLAATVPTRSHPADEPDRTSLAERWEHAIRPLSAGLAVPVFALFAAGVTLVGGGLSTAVRDRAAWAVVLALLIGKPLGVLGATWLTAKVTRARLDPEIAWADVLGVSLLAGIGFTVSLLIGELAFAGIEPRAASIKAAILLGSCLAAAAAAVVLRRRERHYRELAAAEAADEDGDGIPDIYQ